MNLLQEILAYCERTGTRESYLGRMTVGDSTIVPQMKKGRTVTERNAVRIRAMMAKHPEGMHTPQPVANYNKATTSDNRTRWEVAADNRDGSAKLLDALLRMGRAPPEGRMIELPWPDAALAGHSSKHPWVMRPIIKKHREWAEKATRAAMPIVPAEGDIRVSATFYPPHNRGDRVNYPNRLKPYWDGIADALKVNDRRFLPSYHFAEPVADARVAIVIGGDA